MADRQPTTAPAAGMSPPPHRRSGGATTALSSTTPATSVANSAAATPTVNTAVPPPTFPTSPPTVSSVTPPLSSPTSWPRPIAFGATMLASSALNNLFVTYYIPYFTIAGGMSAAWFYVGQAVFMLWNAVNDPLFGWLSDKYGNAATRRSTAIRVGGMLWCAAFALTWLPIPVLPDGTVSVVAAGLHFTLALCFYDGMLTYVEVSHSALLAEMSSSPGDRARCNMWAGVGAAIGSATSLIAYTTWDTGNLTAFRVMCWMVAAACVVVFEASARGVGVVATGANGHSSNTSNNAVAAASSLSSTASSVTVIPAADGNGSANGGGGRGRRHRHGTHRRLPSPVDATPACCRQPSCGSGDHVCTACLSSPGAAMRAPAAATATGRRPAGGEAAAGSGHDVVKPSSSAGSRPLGYILFVRQLTQQRNFMVFALVSALQVFDCTFEKNFFALFLNHLVGHHVTNTGRGVVVSLSFLLPHLCTVVLTPIIRRVGLAALVHRVLWLRLALLAVGFTFGGLSWWTVCLFLLVNRVTSESVCRLTPLIVSDLVDEDAYLYQRPRALSASVVGTVSFVSKFSQSLAPMLGVALLPNTFSTGEDPVEADGHADPLPGGDQDGFRLRLWTLLLAIPVSCVVLQVVLWRWYSLRGRYLKVVKGWAQGAADGLDV